MFRIWGMETLLRRAVWIRKHVDRLISESDYDERKEGRDTSFDIRSRCLNKQCTCNSIFVGKILKKELSVNTFKSWFPLEKPSVWVNTIWRTEKLHCHWQQLKGTSENSIEAIKRQKYRTAWVWPWVWPRGCFLLAWKPANGKMSKQTVRCSCWLIVLTVCGITSFNRWLCQS